jgi:hypothetical protein
MSVKLFAKDTKKISGQFMGLFGTVNSKPNPFLSEIRGLRFLFLDQLQKLDVSLEFL